MSLKILYYSMVDNATVISTVTATAMATARGSKQRPSTKGFLVIKSLFIQWQCMYKMMQPAEKELNSM